LAIYTRALKTPRRSKPPHKPQPPSSADNILRREAAARALSPLYDGTSLGRPGRLRAPASASSSPNSRHVDQPPRRLRPEGRIVELASASLSERGSRQTITKLRTSKKLASSEDYETSSSGTSSLRLSIRSFSVFTLTMEALQ